MHEPTTIVNQKEENKKSKRNANIGRKADLRGLIFAL